MSLKLRLQKLTSKRKSSPPIKIFIGGTVEQVADAVAKGFKVVNCILDDYQYENNRY